MRDNISAFGGDPKNVTIFGESAGAQSVNLLVTSPRAAGLFQRAIAESGVLIAPPKRADELGLQTATLSAAETNGTSFFSELKVKSLAEARSLSADKIQKAKFEGSPVYDDDMLPSDPIALYQRKGFNDTSLLVGYNSDDGGFFAGGGKTPGEFVSAFQGLGEFAKAALDLYPHKDKKEATRSAKEFVKDAYFGWPTWKWATLQAEYGSSKPYIYYFDYRTAKTPDGVPHGAEMGYVFGTVEKPKPQDTEFSNQMASYWVNFAKTGNPNGNGLPRWDAFDPTEPRVMILDKDSKMETWPDLKRIEALDPYFAWQRRAATPSQRRQ